MAKKNLAIYIHIPFCKSKCIYCDFLSMAADETVRVKYVGVLCNEIKKFPNADMYRVCSLFFGGGTPSILDVNLFVLIMDTLRNCFEFDEGCEITVECNPGTVDAEKLECYGKCGVNRLSFGLQSSDNDELKFIGRIHTYEEFEESLRLARAAGFTNINVDLMSALPGQNVSSWKTTLEKIINLKVPHISAYSLIIEENTPLYSMYEAGMLNLPSEDDEREMYYQTGLLLKKAGLSRYEISNYAVSGYECRHNITYWRRGEYAGFGLGAASLLDGVRISNTSSMKDYLQYNNEKNYERLTVNDCMAEFMFLGLRMIHGISITDFEEKFHTGIRTIYGKVIDKYVSSGHLEKEGDIIRLTEKGIDVSNTVFSDFILT